MASSVIAIKCYYFKDVDEECVMHSKSNNTEFKAFDNEVFKSFLSRHQSDFILISAQLLYCKCQKTKCRRGGSYIDSPDWIIKKTTTINPPPKKIINLFNVQQRLY